jgi:hypothetical protein
MKRKLLLIMPNFFDYPQAICEELEKMGYEVDCFDDRPSTNGMVKAIIRVNKNLIGQYPVPGQRPVGTVFGTPRQGLYVQPDVPAPAQRWFRGGKAAHGMDAERPEVPLSYVEAARGAAAG